MYCSLASLPPPTPSFLRPNRFRSQILFQAESYLPSSSRIGAVRVGSSTYLSVMDTAVQRGRYNANYTVLITDTSNFTAVEQSQINNWSLLNQACFLRSLPSDVVNERSRTQTRQDGPMITIGDGSSSILLPGYRGNDHDRALSVVAHTNAAGDLLAYDAVQPSSPHRFSGGPRQWFGA